MAVEERLSSHEDRTWSLLVGVMMWLPAELDTYLERVAKLSHAEYQVLRWLSLSEEREIHMTRLAATASVTPSHLSRIVARLQERGWITRSSDPRDARRTLARLTDAGAGVVAETEPGYCAEVRRTVFAHLTPAQATGLEDIAEAVLTPLREDCVSVLPPRASR
ncbi:MarR family winged helix-turn-helix transcriptional regulator [Cryobacterium sp. SO1]|uniref:MarR family winged helix-turn-helix transcriptional regulator n=1 Tax=Cryobacterium sp. SO1 TaxID=1897061 RepID=UPI001022D377|nr:MarR family transcriptional regulator [Cryobacterium sp. SO1]